MSTSNDPVVNLVNSVQELYARIARPGSGLSTIRVNEEGVTLREFLNDAGIDYDSSAAEGASFVNQHGAVLSPSSIVSPDDVISVGKNRKNG